MKPSFYTITFSFCFICFGFAEDMNRSLLRVDGLVVRLENLGFFVKELDKQEHEIDLSPLFADQFGGIPEGGYVKYNLKGGLLIYKLPSITADFLQDFIDVTVKLDQSLSVAKAYIMMFEKLSDEATVRLAMKTGFYPDPLVAAVVSDLRIVNSHAGPDDPFSAAKALSEAAMERKLLLEKKLVLVIRESIKKMQRQIEVLEE
jgi:hypothetical protein